MPSVARLNGLRVVIYPNDHGPAHVHVIGGGSEAIFLLRCPSGPPELRSNDGFSGAALRNLRLTAVRNTSLPVQPLEKHP